MSMGFHTLVSRVEKTSSYEVEKMGHNGVFSYKLEKSLAE
jgi:hypothetical protein